MNRLSRTRWHSYVAKIKSKIPFRAYQGGIYVLIPLVIIGITGCSKNENNPKALPSTNPIFGNSSPSTSNSQPPDPANTGTNGESRKSMLSFPTFHICGNDPTSVFGSNVVQATEGVEARISGSAVANQNTSNNRTAIINTKSMSLDLTHLEAGSYTLTLHDKKKGVVISNTLAFQKTESGSIQITSTSAPGSIMDGISPNSSLLVIYNLLPLPAPSEGADSESAENPSDSDNCDEYASPLMIDTSHPESQARFDLTAPLSGIQFDIFGTGITKQISWPAVPTTTAFLALPDENGKITSVHQLFGNKTLGPDHLQASNGFAALKKYDSNGDSIIDKSDPIYSQLRLWYDHGPRRGVVDPDELKTLAEMGIESIDLNYQEVFELDRYMNQTRQRSRVKGPRGINYMIVDIWFRPVY